ncbi:ATP synthase subunit b [Aphelenchoides fujianensis]|nr:ATP synthase subunit b [Aphelenchoides fujianensis]
MSLSRFAPPLRAHQPLVFVRAAHQAAPATVAGGTTLPSTNVADSKPGFFQKIVYRFKGIPLAGESERPKSMFDDMGKEFVPPPLPEMPADYKEHPERDLKNFPYPARPQFPPKTRMLMIPDSWCTPFHKITGTSGPYLFFGGVGAFYLNKELWVFEEQGHMLVGWILFYLLLSRTIGYRVDKAVHNWYRERMDYFNKLIADDLKDAVEFRKTSAAETASFNAIKGDFPTIFRENLALQLEATYRKNVDQVATELKRRLDYLKEVEETKQRFEREIFLRGILDGVQQSIEKNEGNIKDKYLESCITQIKGLKL